MSLFLRIILKPLRLMGHVYYENVKEGMYLKNDINGKIFYILNVEHHKILGIRLKTIDLQDLTNPQRCVMYWCLGEIYRVPKPDIRMKEYHDYNGPDFFRIITSTHEQRMAVFQALLPEV